MKPVTPIHLWLSTIMESLDDSFEPLYGSDQESTFGVDDVESHFLVDGTQKSSKEVDTTSLLGGVDNDIACELSQLVSRD